jgi:hypothetical protein
MGGVTRGASAAALGDAVEVSCWPTFGAGALAEGEDAAPRCAPCGGATGGGAVRPGAAAGWPARFSSTVLRWGACAAAAFGISLWPLREPDPNVLPRRPATMPTAPPATTMMSAAVAHARVHSESDGRTLRGRTRTGLNESCAAPPLTLMRDPLTLMRDSEGDSDSPIVCPRGCVG